MWGNLFRYMCCICRCRKKEVDVQFTMGKALKYGGVEFANEKQFLCAKIQTFTMMITKQNESNSCCIHILLLTFIYYKTLYIEEKVYFGADISSQELRFESILFSHHVLYWRILYINESWNLKLWHEGTIRKPLRKVVFESVKKKIEVFFCRWWLILICKKYNFFYCKSIVIIYCEYYWGWFPWNIVVDYFIIERFYEYR